MDFGTAQFHEFGFDAFLFEFAQSVAEQNCCIPASASTTVERDNLHVSSVSQDQVNERPYSLAVEQPTLCSSMLQFPTANAAAPHVVKSTDNICFRCSPERTMAHRCQSRSE